MLPLLEVRSTRLPWINDAEDAALISPSAAKVTRPRLKAASPVAVTAPIARLPAVCFTTTLPLVATALSKPPLRCSASGLTTGSPAAPPTLPVALSVMLCPEVNALSLICTMDRLAVDTPDNGATPLPALITVLPDKLRMVPLSSTSEAELIVTRPLSKPLNSILMGLSALRDFVVIVLVGVVWSNVM